MLPVMMAKPTSVDMYMCPYTWAIVKCIVEGIMFQLHPMYVDWGRAGVMVRGRDGLREGGREGEMD